MSEFTMYQPNEDIEIAMAHALVINYGFTVDEAHKAVVNEETRKFFFANLERVANERGRTQRSNNITINAPVVKQDADIAGIIKSIEEHMRREVGVRQ